jgi:hypothetical protein
MARRAFGRWVQPGLLRPASYLPSVPARVKRRQSAVPVVLVMYATRRACQARQQEIPQLLPEASSPEPLKLLAYPADRWLQRTVLVPEVPMLLALPRRLQD